MKEKVKLWVDTIKPTKDWIHIKDFDSFKHTLHTLRFSQIECISFGDEIEQDEYYSDIMHYVPTDCAVALIEEASGSELPQCFVHSENKDVMDTINHYVKSYKHENYCGKIKKLTTNN